MLVRVDEALSGPEALLLIPVKLEVAAEGRGWGVEGWFLGLVSKYSDSLHVGEINGLHTQQKRLVKGHQLFRDGLWSLFLALHILYLHVLCSVQEAVITAILPETNDTESFSSKLCCWHQSCRVACISQIWKEHQTNDEEALLLFTAKETIEQNLSFPPSPKVACSFPTVSGCWSRYTHNIGDNSLRFKLLFSKPTFPNNASSTFEMLGEILPPLSRKRDREAYCTGQREGKKVLTGQQPTVPLVERIVEISLLTHEKERRA